MAWKGSMATVMPAVRPHDDARCDRCGVLLREGERLVVREVVTIVGGHGGTSVSLLCEACAS